MASKLEKSDEQERRLLRLLSYLAFAIEEAENLGYSETSIEIRRASLQLCFESGGNQELATAFKEGVEDLE